MTALVLRQDLEPGSDGETNQRNEGIPESNAVDVAGPGQNLLRSSATLPASAEVQDVMQDIIHDVFANEDTVPRGKEILAALRRSLDVMFPNRPLSEREKIRIGERQAKTIFLHAYMDRHDFDLERLRKCCHHYPQTDGRVMPACGFNMFHRGAAQGPDTPRATFGKGPFGKSLPVIA